MSLKRKVEWKCTEEPAKHARHSESEDERECPDPQLDSELLRLSDYVLLAIMTELQPLDLLNLSRTCMRLKSLCRDRSLWAEMDLRCYRLKFCQLWAYISFLQPSTRLIAMQGKEFVKRLPKCWRTFRKILTNISDKCKNLESFLVEQYAFDARKVKLSHFPHTLKKLSLASCHVSFLDREGQSYFHNIHEMIPQLEVLDLSRCSWFTGHSLMAISKCPNLRELYLVGNWRLADCSAYISLSTRFGFRKLEVLDVRRTYLCDSDVNCFNHINTLTHLYLEFARVPHRPQVHNESEHSSEECDCTDIMLLQGEHSTLDNNKQNNVEHSTGLGKCPNDKGLVLSDEDEHEVVEETALGENKTEKDKNEGKMMDEDDEDQEEVDRPDLDDEDIQHNVLYGTLYDPNIPPRITDLGLVNLGTERYRIDMVLATPRPHYIRLGRPGGSLESNPNLQHLTVRGFQDITDVSLEHLVRVASLRSLDISGTSVTLSGVQQFVSKRSDIQLISDYTNEL